MHAVPLQILDNPTLGDTVLSLTQADGECFPISIPIPPMSPVPWQEAVHALELRVATLESRTVAARWSRLLAAIRAWWQRVFRGIP